MDDKMINRLHAYLEKDPDDTFTLFALALEYQKQGEDHRARSFFEAILSKDPGYVGTYYHLGKLYENNGATKKARSTYQKGIQVAEAAGDRKALAELQEALQIIGQEVDP